MSQLSEFVKSALAKGQTRETIKESLLQNNWKAEDIEQAFLDIVTLPPPPPPSVSASVPTRSKIPIVVGVIGGIILVVGVGAYLWSTSQAPPIVPHVSTTSSLFAEPTSGSDPAPDSVTTPSTARPTSGPVASEIDVYGTDLYALREGKTVADMGKKSIVVSVNGQNQTELERTIVTYTRAGDRIRVGIEKTSPHSQVSYNSAFMLNAKKNYDSALSNVKARLQKICQDPSTPDCVSSSARLKKVEEACANAITDKEVNICMGSYTSRGYATSAGEFLWKVFLAPN